MAGLKTVTSIPHPVTVHALTGVLHDHQRWLIQRPLQILAIIVVTLLVRALVHRAIDKVVKASSSGRVPRLLSPLKEHALESALLGASGLLSERRRQRAGTIGSVLKSTTSMVLFVLAFLVIIGLVGVNLAPFIAGTSIIGAAIAFGAQNVVKDFLAGIFMILEDQYGVGDVIDVKEATGTVEAVGLRTTRLRDVEGTVWYVRNGEVARVGNKSQQYANVVVDIPISATDDLDAALDAITSAIAAATADEAWSRSYLDPPEVLGVESLDKDTTLIRVSAKVRPLEQWRVARDLRARIRTAFDDQRQRQRQRHRIPPEHRD